METKASNYREELKLLVLEDYEVIDKLDVARVNLSDLENYLNLFEFERDHKVTIDMHLNRVKESLLHAICLLKKNQMCLNMDE